MMAYQFGGAPLRNLPLRRAPGSLLPNKLDAMLRGIHLASSGLIGKTVMAVLMGGLIVSFGLWGIADIFRGFGQSTVAKVGHAEISREEFRQLFTEQQQRARQPGRSQDTDPTRLGIDLLHQMMAETALNEQARQLGLGQSDEEIRRAITNDPNFRGAGGVFDPHRFREMIRTTEQRYVNDRRQDSLRRQIVGTIPSGLEPPKTMIDVINRYLTEQRTIEFVRLNAVQAGQIDPPSPEALATYFEDHKALFSAPEYRKIALVVITPEDVAKTIEVSDEDAKKVFEERKSQLSTPEKRQVYRIQFPSIEEAQAARNRLSGGLSFEDLAKERGSDPADIDLGLLAKSSILDPAVADAAFSLASGEISQPVQGPFGVALVKVDKIVPGAEANYADVAANLKQELAALRARGEVSNLHDKMEDERGSGASATEAAEKLGLKPVTIDAVDRSGRTPDGQPAAAIPKGLDVVSQAFKSNVGADNDPISFQGGYVWYDVISRTPPRERSLDEVKAQVEARWHQDQVASRLRAKATELEKKLEQGTKLEEIAASIGVKVDTATGFTRTSAPAGVPLGAIPAAFRTAKDGIGQAPSNDGSEVIVFRVTNIVDPPTDMDSAGIKELRQNLIGALAVEQYLAYVNKLETNLGTSINQEAFAQVIGKNQ